MALIVAVEEAYGSAQVGCSAAEGEAMIAFYVTAALLAWFVVSLGVGLVVGPVLASRA